MADFFKWTVLSAFIWPHVIHALQTPDTNLTSFNTTQYLWASEGTSLKVFCTCNETVTGCKFKNMGRNLRQRETIYDMTNPDELRNQTDGRIRKYADHGPRACG